MLSVIAARNRNSPAQVVQKCARRLIDGTQCLLLLLLLLYIFIHHKLIVAKKIQSKKKTQLILIPKTMFMFNNF